MKYFEDRKRNNLLPIHYSFLTCLNDFEVDELEMAAFVCINSNYIYICHSGHKPISDIDSIMFNHE